MNFSSQKLLINMYFSVFLIFICYLFIKPLIPIFGIISFNNWNFLTTQINYSPKILNNLFISLKISMLGTVFSCIFCTLVAYGLAIYQFKFKTLVIMFVIFILLIPETVKLMPFIITLHQTGLSGSDWGLWLPFIVPSLGILIMYYYLNSILNAEILDAARVEGASEWLIFYKIFLPVLKPAIAFIAIIQFSTIWNAYELSVVTIGIEELRPAAHQFRSENVSEVAMIIFTLIPLLFLIICSYYIVQFIKSGIKHS
ncbi:MAG: carbohydrate ABC transporter permease [Saccharospirillaceae bacterium]|nr:ABC transporter permease subunit [Pseudomonadales bacterium]NRB79415.1 carbohydrate ABC transporter permease [Saccharospirillaceae bacterium]